MPANDFKVGDKVRRRVGNAREVGMTAAGTALIDQKNMVPQRIKEGSVKGLRSASRATMQKYDWPAAFRADFLDVDPMAVANIEHAGVKGTE
jgi:hypothetical protein